MPRPPVQLGDLTSNDLGDVALAEIAAGNVGGSEAEGSRCHLVVADQRGGLVRSGHRLGVCDRGPRRPQGGTAVLSRAFIAVCSAARIRSWILSQR
jgi:hypothetical protein